uniref:Uncharacterized protein n=1 Tax=Amphimedon queenslandica TaxID=400682 RepID=A0A1X7UCQ4_AMPQE
MEALADIADMHINVPNLTLEERGTMLNVDQKRIFDKIKSHLISQKEREDLLENESLRLHKLFQLPIEHEERQLDIGLGTKKLRKGYN